MKGNNFMTSVQVKSPKRNTFDLSHDVKMSGKMGNLYPCMLMECLPGDAVRIGCNNLIRFAPMLAPIMHRVDVSVHYWFVPNRIVWDGWERFITGDEANPAVMPVIRVSDAMTADQRKFLDYFGIPPIPDGSTAIRDINAIPIAAYQMIYNNFYRDQNLIDAVPDKLEDGLNAFTNYAVLRKRAWEHDYFTSALPFAQKGAAVSLPVGDVYLKDDWESHAAFDSAYPYFSRQGAPNSMNLGPMEQYAEELTAQALTVNDGVENTYYAYDPKGSLAVLAGNITTLRAAIALQEFLELNARVGTRYTEYLQGQWDVRAQDARLQLPEYITGIKSPVIVSEVLNTTGTEDAPQGDMAGHGVSVASGKYGNYYCQEHGYIIGIMSVMPKTAYQDGMPKTFMKNDYLDFANPRFAHLSEQPVLNDEIYAYHLTLGNGTFGYMPVYSDYRTIFSRVAGDFRTTLDFWHMGRKFGGLPTLSQEFIEMDYTDVDRVFAVQDGTDNLWCHLYHEISASRKLPRFGTPQL